ncbi:hypothetical protein NT01EI_0568 [Edwardsiella ictaluri 93-146]|uniref:Uncharacterized protein n=1 Tax=Edwardsiella ictaluri (strain 93-146) TaxID=634503 RepID=C5BHJ8_EDWI9|nr:hypothetical protein NT01EI_0568 [Edwardsiella ictaluri 93-146]
MAHQGMDMFLIGIQIAKVYASMVTMSSGIATGASSWA